jgi:hypothetical protein
MTEKCEADSQRIPRLIGSLLFIGLGLTGIAMACDAHDVSPFFPLTVFVGFLIVSAVLIALIAGRLYAQHELRRFKFDIANLILITTLVSLPLAVAGIFWNLIEPNIGDQFKNDGMWSTMVITGVLFFLMFPVFFITEALLSWCRKLAQRRTQ